MSNPPQPSSDDLSAVFGIYKEQFFAELGLQDLPLEEKERRWEEMEEVIMGRVFLRLEDNLTPELLEIWRKCKTDEEMNTFFQQNDVPIVDLIMNEAGSYREEMVANMAYIHGRMDGDKK